MHVIAFVDETVYFVTEVVDFAAKI